MKTFTANIEVSHDDITKIVVTLTAATRQLALHAVYRMMAQLGIKERDYSVVMKEGAL